MTESHWSAVVLHRVTKNPVFTGVWKRIPVNLAFRLVDRMSHSLGNTVREDAALRAASERQRAWGEARLAEDPGLGCVVMGHTHLPMRTEPFPGRQFLNPGAWLDGFRYGVVTGSTADLAQWRG